MEEELTMLDKNGKLKSGEVFLPKIFYENYKLNNQTSEELLGKIFDYVGQINNDSEKFVYDAYMSFIAAKNEFLNGRKTLGEIYKQADGVFGLDNYQYIDFVNKVFSFSRFVEYEQDNIDYKKLKVDAEFCQCKKNCLGYPTQDEKVTLVELRNSIAHSRFRIFVEDQKLKLVLLTGENGNKNSIKMSAKTFEAMFDILRVYTNPDSTKKFDDIGKAETAQPDKNESDFKSLSEIKKDMINFRFFQKGYSPNIVKQDVNAMLNGLIIENPDLKSSQILSVLSQEIQKKYNGENEIGKREALYFVKDIDAIRAQDALQLCQYIFTSKKFSLYSKQNKLPDDIINFLKERFNVEDIIKSNKLAHSGEKDFYKMFIKSLRHSVIHDKVVISPEGELVFKTTNSEGLRLYRKGKEKLQKLKVDGKHYKEKVAQIKKTYTPPQSTIVPFAELSTEDVYQLCQMIMNGTPEKRKRKDKSVVEEGQSEKISHQGTKKTIEINKCDRKIKIKQRNLLSRANQNISNENEIFLSKREKARQVIDEEIEN